MHPKYARGRLHEIVASACSSSATLWALLRKSTGGIQWPMRNQNDPPQSANMESKLKHLEMIQGVINRMASNSFRLKGWSIVLVSALLVLIAREDESKLSYIGLFPVIVFWCLDAYFLRQERLFRSLYDHVRKLGPDEIDFSMDTTPFQNEVSAWRCVLISKTLVPFYVAVAIAVVVAVIVNESTEVVKHGT